MDALYGFALIHCLKHGQPNYTNDREYTSKGLKHCYRFLIDEYRANKSKESGPLAYGGDDADVLLGLGSLVISRENHEVAQEVKHTANVREALGRGRDITTTGGLFWTVYLS